MVERSETYGLFWHYSISKRFGSSLLLMMGVFLFIFLSAPATSLASAFFYVQPVSSTSLKNFKAEEGRIKKETPSGGSNTTFHHVRLPNVVDANPDVHLPDHLVASDALESIPVSPLSRLVVREMNNSDAEPESRENGPDGKYCGGLSLGVIKGKLFAKPLQSVFDFHMEGLNQNITCEDEKYIYDRVTHHADVPGSRDPEDCLGELLTAANLTLDVIYYPKKDQVKLDFGFTSVKCKKCE